MLTITVHPVRRALVRRNVPDWLVAIAVVLSVYFLLFSVSIALVISAGRLAELLPQYKDEFAKYTADVTDWLAVARHHQGPGQRPSASSIDPSSVVGVIGDAFNAVLAVLSNFFFIVTVALMMAFDTGGVERVMGVVRTTRPHLVDAMVSFAHGTRVYMGVAAGFGFIVAVIDGVALYVMGVPGAFIWAVLAFVTNFIPNIGFVIGVIPPAIIGLLEGGPALMIGVIVVYSVINVVIQSVIQPRYVGDAVGLSPTITLALADLLGLGARRDRRAARGAVQPVHAGDPRRGRPHRPLGAPDPVGAPRQGAAGHPRAARGPEHHRAGLSRTDRTTGPRGGRREDHDERWSPVMTELTTAERKAQGKAAREKAPLESHAEIGPDAGRDPVGLIIGQAATRVPDLVPIRHGRMLASPFTFYRGAALPMAADLSRDAVVRAARAAVR